MGTSDASKPLNALDEELRGRIAGLDAELEGLDSSWINDLERMYLISYRASLLRQIRFRSADEERELDTWDAVHRRQESR